MKKNLFSIILSALLALSATGCGTVGTLPPSATSDAGSTVSSESTQATSSQSQETAAQPTSSGAGQTISTSGEHVISGVFSGQILVTVPDVTLVLDGVDITSTNGPGILSEEGDLTVELRGENSVSGADHGIQGKDTLIITGEGSVNVTAVKDGLHAGDELRIEGGTVNVVESNEGMEAPSIVVSGGKSTVFAADDGINAAVDEGDATVPSILFTGGEMVIYANSDGIDSNGTFDVTGGTVAVFVNAPQDGNATDIDSTRSIQTPALNVNAQVKAGTEIAVNDWNITTEADATAFCLILPGVADGQSYSVTADGTELTNVTATTALQGMMMRGGGRGGFGGERPEGGMTPPEGMTPGARPERGPMGDAPTDGAAASSQA
jgi:predicted small lipoprotein YifL